MVTALRGGTSIVTETSYSLIVSLKKLYIDDENISCSTFKKNWNLHDICLSEKNKNKEIPEKYPKFKYCLRLKIIQIVQLQIH